mgnify:CR=1 FL=1
MHSKGVLVCIRFRYPLSSVVPILIRVGNIDDEYDENEVPVPRRLLGRTKIQSVTVPKRPGVHAIRRHEIFGKGTVSGILEFDLPLQEATAATGKNENEQFS